MVKILIIDDDKDIRNNIAEALSGGNYSIYLAESGEEGLEIFKNENPDLILVDLNLPCIDGYEVIRRIRHIDMKVKIVILSERNKAKEINYGFTFEIDDYFPKPFDIGILESKIENVLAHERKPTPYDVFEDGRLKINYAKRAVFVKDEEVHLTHYEYKVLVLFSKNPGKLLTSDYILDTIWSLENPGTKDTLKTIIKQIRYLIEEDHHHPKIITNQYGEGYRFNLTENK